MIFKEGTMHFHNYSVSLLSPFWMLSGIETPEIQVVNAITSYIHTYQQLWQNNLFIFDIWDIINNLISTIFWNLENTSK